MLSNRRGMLASIFAAGAATLIPGQITLAEDTNPDRREVFSMAEADPTEISSYRTPYEAKAAASKAILLVTYMDGSQKRYEFDWNKDFTIEKKVDTEDNLFNPYQDLNTNSIIICSYHYPLEKKIEIGTYKLGKEISGV